MSSFFGMLMMGFFLGIRHAMDPDHVIAVSTIVARQRGLVNAGIIGALWGMGHTVTICLVGAAIILFKVVIPPQLGLLMEFSVGLMLIVLGVLNLGGTLLWLQREFTPRSEVLPRKEGAPVGSWLERAFRDMGLYDILRPLIIGIVHGLAGSAAVALLVLTAIRAPSSSWVTAYLALFGLGTIAGMMAMTVSLAFPIGHIDGLSGWSETVSMGSGLLSVIFGLFISYQVGIEGGLFSSNWQWAPH